MPQASMAAYSGKSVVQKLGIQPGFRIFAAGPPAAYSDIVGKLPDDVTMATGAKAPLDMVHDGHFATKISQQPKSLRFLKACLAYWLCTRAAKTRPARAKDLAWPRP